MAPKNNFLSGTIVVCGGFAIGWIAGLSVSPVATSIVSSVLALLLATASAYGVETKEAGAVDNDQEHRKRQPNIILLSLSVIGMSLGLTMGILARTNDLLGLRPDHLVHRWTTTGLKVDEISQHLFDATFGTPRGTGQQSVHRAGVLFAFDANECEELRAASDSELKHRLAYSSTDEAAAFARICEHVPSIRRYVEERACPR